jgi:hypothetical protein
VSRGEVDRWKGQPDHGLLGLDRARARTERVGISPRGHPGLFFLIMLATRILLLRKPKHFPVQATRAKFQRSFLSATKYPTNDMPIGRRGPTRENLGNCTAGGNAFVNSRHHPPGHLTYPEHAHKETSGAPAGNAPRKLKLVAKISQIAVENNAAPTGIIMRPIADNSGTVLSPTDMPAKHD